MQANEMITKDDHLDAVNALRAEYLGRYMAVIGVIGSKNSEVAEWRQAAQVEAKLRREFLDRAEKAETEVERLLAILRGLVSAIDNDAADTMLLRSAAYVEAQRLACEQKLTEADEPIPAPDCHEHYGADGRCFRCGATLED